MVEHKGGSTWMLRELGWIEVQGKRVRVSECKLRSDEKLLELRRELLDLMRDAREFIGFIFKSDSKDWVDRCSGIIKVR
jgi:hypothetical protein